MMDSSSPMTPMEPEGLPTHMDRDVATDFCTQETTFLDIDETKPHMALLFYGLVCLDLKGELLMPNSAAAALKDVHLHHPRLFTKGLEGFTPDGTLMVPDPSSATSTVSPLSYWDLKNYHISWTAIDSSGNHIVTTPTVMTVKNRPDRNPWCDFRYVRDITRLTGLKLLAPDKRANANLIASRVALPGGNLEAVPPYTRFGMMAEWSVTELPTNRETVGSTTDSMLLTYQWPDAAAAVRVDFRPIDEHVIESKPSVVFPFIANKLTFALTHASEAPMEHHGELRDTRAFALLLEGGDVDAYPIAKFKRGARGQKKAGVFQSMANSGSDGHCDCGVAP
jgi:hypothetical protein